MESNKIVIDARELRTSTGRYMERLLDHLQQIDTEHQYTVLLKPQDFDGWEPSNPNFIKLSCPYPEFTFDEQMGFKKQLDGLQAALVHFGMSQQPVRYKGKTVTTIHDLTTLRFTNPDKNTLVFKIKQRVYAYVVKRAAQKSSAILVPSQFVKDDLVSYTGVNPEKITVTYEAVGATPDKSGPVLEAEGKQFIMYVGRPTPHKNLERLIDAFVALKGQHPDLHLVLVGKRDANYRRIEAAVQKRGIEQVIFTDFVNDEQLRWLYEHCEAYVFPSLSEGFGLPGLEAMAHGAPVVSSNAACLPEIYGDAAHYFDPNDTQAMADAINEVLTDQALRASLVEKGRKQAGRYSWEKTARQTLSVYEAVLRS